MDIYNNEEGQLGLDKYEDKDEKEGKIIEYISFSFIAPLFLV